MSDGSESPTWALVTGASRGIGAAIAIELAAAGHAILINYRSNHGAGREVLAQIEAGGGRAELLPFDVADADAAGAAIASVLDAGKVVDVLVNNAGVSADAPFPALEREDWERVLAPTLGGFYNVTRPLVMPMVRRRHGRIINISSVSGLVGNRGQVNYSAAKAGLHGATKALARELAKRKITVNAVAPGLIDTDMASHAPAAEMVKMIPMRRMGTAVEVAKLVRFLASEDACYLTGQIIALDGGLT